MSEISYSVSEASKLLEVQSHVLRYWEEELQLPVGRNGMGHRYYTRADIQVILSIKELKKKGLSLKEIKGLVPFFYDSAGSIPSGETMKQEISEKKEKAVPVKQKSQESPRKRQEVKKKEPDAEQFLEILDKLVRERMAAIHSEERYKRLDERIRICQKSRREVAAAIEKEHKESRRLFRRKK